MNRTVRNTVGMVLAIVVILSAIFGGVRWISGQDAMKPEVQLPVLVIIGLATMLTVLTLMALTFSTYGLADRNQALGLPDGSIRSVIALSLIVIFAVTVIYLFATLSATEGATTVICCPGTASTDTTAPTATGTTGTVTTGSGTATTTVTDTAAKELVEKSKRDERRSDDERKRRPSEDFARELLIMLGTLITSVTGFYFGSRASASTPGGVMSPKLDSIDPITGSLGDKPLPLTLRGSGLLAVNGAKLRKGGTDIAATNVISGESEVRCEVMLPTTVDPGKWDVIVTTRDGAEAKLPEAFTVSPGASSSQPSHPA